MMNFHALGILLLIAAASPPCEAGRCETGGCAAKGKTIVNQVGLTGEEKQAIVELHNGIRRSVASGDVEGEHGVLLPPASDLNDVAWSDDLATMAQEQMDRCQVEEGLTKEELDNKATQHIALWDDVKETPLETIESIFEHYRGLAKKFHIYMVDQAQEEWGVYGQLILAKVTEIGCGYNIVEHEEKELLQFVCNYSPPMELGQKLYTRECASNDVCCSKGHRACDMGLNQTQIRAILKVHKRLRIAVKDGEQQGSGGKLLPTSAIMPRLSWNTELAQLAQDQAFSDCDGLDDASGEEDVDDIVEGWASQSQYFDGSMIESFPVGSMAKAFAQMISAKTTDIGCGLVKREKGESQDHTQKFVCKYSPELVSGEQVYTVCDPTDNCCKNEMVLKQSGLNDDEKDAIVKLHNDFRRSVAKGLVSGENGIAIPPVSNMHKLTWSEDLANKAQAWADKCDAYVDGSFMVVNAPWEEQSTLVTVTGNVQSRLSKAENDITTYEQLIWAETTKVGCGFSIVTDTSDDTDGQNFACYYEEQMVEGDEVYKVGSTASECSNGEDDGLCLAP